jgi:DNA-binding MarR family transcriptional regulator
MPSAGEAVVDYEPVALRLAHGLSRAAVAIDMAGDGTAGLERTFAQQLILLHLRQRYGTFALDELATALAMTETDTLAALGTLAREGLVAMSPTPSYTPHEVRVGLTERGRAEAPELLNWAADLLVEIDRLSEEEQRQLLQLVVERIIAMQSSGQIPVTRMCMTCRFFEPYAHVGSDAPHHCHLVEAPFGSTLLRLRCPEQEPRQPA